MHTCCDLPYVALSVEPWQNVMRCRTGKCQAPESRNRYAHHKLCVTCDASPHGAPALPCAHVPTQEAPDQGRSRLFGPAPLNLDKAREYAGSSLHRARVKGEVGPLEVDCLQSQSGHWFCEVARPRGPREGPEDVFILHPASRASRPDIGAGVRARRARARVHPRSWVVGLLKSAQAAWPGRSTRCQTHHVSQLSVCWLQVSPRADLGQAPACLPAACHAHCQLLSIVMRGQHCFPARPSFRVFSCAAAHHVCPRLQCH